MKVLSSVAAALATASCASGHYIFIQLTANGVKGADYDNIRKNTNYNSPVTDLTSNDLRCNVGGESGSATTVVNMKAGDPFTFTTDTAVYHDGPISLFLSRAGGSVQDYDGSGKWLKFYDWGPTFSGSSSTWPLRQTYTNNLPKCLPDGEYLLRIQSLGIHNPWPAGIPQFYTSCAQINVTGASPTTWSKWTPTLDIPGVFKSTDPGYTVNIYNPGFTSYTPPGGPVWSCD